MISQIEVCGKPMISNVWLPVFCACPEIDSKEWTGRHDGNWIYGKKEGSFIEFQNYQTFSGWLWWSGLAVVQKMQREVTCMPGMK